MPVLRKCYECEFLASKIHRRWKISASKCCIHWRLNHFANARHRGMFRCCLIVRCCSFRDINMVTSLLKLVTVGKRHLMSGPWAFEPWFTQQCFVTESFCIILWLRSTLMSAYLMLNNLAYGFFPFKHIIVILQIVLLPFIT